MNARRPVYHVLLKNWACYPTTVVAGPTRRRTWLYVHDTTPTVLRLHPPVVAFLRTTLDHLADGRHGTWSLRKDSGLLYPGCVVIGQPHKSWLYVMSASPSRVELFPDLIDFLRDTLAQLPTAPAEAPLP